MSAPCETAFASTIRDCLRQTSEVMRALAEDVSAIESAADAMLTCVRGGGKILFCGNGGSAADSQHLATELVSKYRLDRPGIPALALTTDTSALTAIANDYAYERVFARQVETLGNPGDVLVGISTSGNSPNVIRAAEAARAKGMRSIGLVGGHGGKLAQVVDLAIVVPSADTPRIQEGHIAVGHILCDILEATLNAKIPSQSPLAT